MPAATPPRSKVTIYTDGSCLSNPGPGGWAAILVHDRTGATKEISGGEAHTTNNRMELTAAIKAFQALNRPTQTDMYTDSTYLQNAFVKGWLKSWQERGWRKADKKPVENADLWQELLKATAAHTISWHHVKAHAGHAYNERCDELAKEQATHYQQGH
ncbi:ribonuclease HI [bacterium]|nr:ribonuclease HI [bacterium]